MARNICQEKHFSSLAQLCSSNFKVVITLISLPCGHLWLIIVVMYILYYLPTLVVFIILCPNSVCSSRFCAEVGSCLLTFNVLRLWVYG